MAPRQHSGSADPGAPRPDQFDHQKYDYRPAKSDGGIMGAIQNVVGVVGDASQRMQLEQGLSMRPTGHIPRTNAASYNHPELYRMVQTAQGSQANELGQMWNDLGNEIMDFGASLHRTATSSEAIWVGQAGNAARSTLSGLADWSNTTGQGVQYMGTTVRTQADAADTAKSTMPHPVDYNPAEYQARMLSTMNPVEWVQIIGDARQQADKQQAAYAEAVRVTETYSTSLHDVSSTMPAFTPPPQFGNGDTGMGGGSAMPGGGPGGGAGGSVPPGGGGSVPPLGHPTGVHGGPGVNPPGVPVPPIHPGGPGGPGGVAPSPTPGQSVPQVPSLPGSGGPGGPGSGAEAVPGFVPAAGIGVPGGEPGSGARIGGGRPGGVGGGFGPRGGAGPNSVGRSALGSLGEAEGAAGAGRSAAAMAGRGAGAGSEMAPMAGGGRGRGDDDSEHRRPSYLVETEDVWGDGRRVAPPVIGEDPPDYYH